MSKTLSSNKSGYTLIGISTFSFFDKMQKLGIPVAASIWKMQKNVVFFLSCLNIKAGYNN